MKNNHARGMRRKGTPHPLPGMRVLLFSAIGCGLILSACAKRPEVVTIAPVSPASPSLEAGVPRAGEPGGGPSMGGPGGGVSDAGGASLGGPEGGPGARGPGEEGGRAGTGAATPSKPLPPGSELVAPPPAPKREQPVEQLAQATPKESPLKDIFFDFDKADIRLDARAPLGEDVVWLKAHSAAAVTIEGHCDERGTSEYNLGLGDRRSRATKDYLVASGVDGKRLHTVSYGKERPFVLGHDESAWKWNRRAHFVITKE